MRTCQSMLSPLEALSVGAAFRAMLGLLVSAFAFLTGVALRVFPRR